MRKAGSKSSLCKDGKGTEYDAESHPSERSQWQRKQGSGRAASTDTSSFRSHLRQSVSSKGSGRGEVSGGQPGGIDGSGRRRCSEARGR